MSRDQLAQQWRQRLHEFEQENTTIVDFCFRHRIPQHRFFYWKRRLAAEPSHTTATRPAFVAVDLSDNASKPAQTGVSLRLAGATIDLTQDFDPATLRAVVVALSGLPC
jgi:hypothetical protein